MGYLTDASYKQAQAEVYGQLTTSAVATGSQLVAFSGFSNSNYVREAYSADLDFGTGDWSASAWVNTSNPNINANFWPNPETALGVTSLQIQSDVETAPNGTLTADKLVAPATNEHHFGGAQFTAPAGSFVVSVYAKKAGYGFITLGGGSNDWNGWARAIFDLNTGACKVLNTGYGSVSNPLMQDVFGDGSWWRCSVIVSGTGQVFYGPSPNYNTSNTFLGDGASGVFIWGLMVNLGTAAGTYTPGKTTVYNPLPGARIASRSFSSGASIDLSIDGYGYLSATAYDGTTTRTVTTDAAYNTGTWLKVRVNYQAGKLAILVNGVEVKSTVGAPLLSLNSRYNLQKYSEQFEQWSKRQNATVTADTTISPNNTLTADTITSGNSTDTEACAYYTHLGLNEIVIGSTMSCYFKAGTSSIVWIQGREGGNPYAVYNLSTQSLLGSSGCTPSIVDVGNGWYRIILANLTVGANYFAVGGKDVYTSGTPWGSGTWNSGNTIFAWGAQLESGSTVKTYQRVGVDTDFDFKAPLTIGNNYAATAPFPGSIALLKFSATVPSIEQSIWMYEQEKQMFREGAQVALPDANAIQDLAYDDLTDRWIAVSTTNKSTWSGLVRTASEAVSAGSYTKVSAASGIQLAARSTTNPGVDITIPAYNVKARAKKKAEKSKKLTNATAIYDFTPVVFSNATLTNGSNVMTVTAANTTGTPYIGMGITGTGIAAGTTIVGIVSGTPNSYYLSAAYTGTTGSTYTVGQSTFSLPVGYTARFVYSGGLIQREGSTKAFTRTFDGFRETILFGTSPGTSVVQIHAVKQ